MDDEEPIELTDFAVRLKEMRVEKGWSQPKLANAVGVRTASVWKWENARAVPRLQHMIALADVFDCSLRELVALAPPVKAHPRHGRATNVKRRTPFASGE